MADLAVLEVLLHGARIGTLTRLPDDRIIFGFDPSYIGDTTRATLSLSFKDEIGALITDIPPTQTRLLPFFSNLLPEGSLRDYLARRAGVNPEREFFLLWVLGQDLPGALTVRPADSEALPPRTNDAAPAPEIALTRDAAPADDAARVPLRFSLAGVQLKLSAVMKANGGLTIPVRGMGGDWIVKLPSATFPGVSENEFAMMTLARRIGLEVPEIRLVRLNEIDGLPPDLPFPGATAFAIKRFDRLDDAGTVHIEDFAQVFGVYPANKYERATYRNIAAVLWAEAGEAATAEFIRRLVFNTLIGNGDMHLKNWSLIYPDRRSPTLAPAYDFVATIAYIQNERLALGLVRGLKAFSDVSRDALAAFASKAKLPEKLVLDTAAETVSRFHDAWNREKASLDLSRETIALIEKHIARVPIAAGR